VIAGVRVIADLPVPAGTPPFPTERFSIIYADPPWRFRNWADGDAAHGAASNHYAVLDTAALQGLPVASIAAKDCVLVLWACSPLLPEALAVMRAWGFTYKTVGWAWVKSTPTGRKYHTGLGYYTRQNAEFLLLGTRGRVPRISKAISQIVETEAVIAPVGRHSAKPHIFRDRIVALFGDLPRIELFARSKAPGWHDWGLETGTRPTQLELGTA
jgi:N6-adenosine-specific RNA methylase IME4